MAEEQEQAAEAQPEAAPQEASEPSSSRTPIGRAYHAMRQGLDTAENKIFEGSESLGGQVKNLLGFEKRTVEEKSGLATLVYATGHILDGTVLNTLRRAEEVIEPLLRGTQTAIHKVLHPIDTIIHPLTTIKDALHIAASVGTAAKNTILSPIRWGDELIERTIMNTATQINTKISKIPAIESLFAKGTNWVAGIATKISNSVRNALDWVGSPFDKFQTATA